ncbi:hypothetical protein KCU86_g786, partial [Aureobasidium melanogenum]
TAAQLCRQQTGLSSVDAKLYRLEKLISELSGRNIQELIPEGSTKLTFVPSGGATAMSTLPPPSRRTRTPPTTSGSDLSNMATQQSTDDRAADQHTADDHTADDHTADDHTADDHTADDHTAEQPLRPGAVDGHSDDSAAVQEPRITYYDAGGHFDRSVPLQDRDVVTYHVGLGRSRQDPLPTATTDGRVEVFIVLNEGRIESATSTTHMPSRPVDFNNGKQTKLVVNFCDNAVISAVIEPSGDKVYARQVGVQRGNGLHRKRLRLLSSVSDCTGLDDCDCEECQSVV